MISVDALELSEYLWWVDEVEWTPVVQEEGYSVAGALLLDVSVKQAGRPITLVGEEGVAWLSRATVLALQAMAADPEREMDLNIHGRHFTVRFRHGDGKPLEAEPVVRINPPADTDWYMVKALRFLVIDEPTGA